MSNESIALVGLEEANIIHHKAIKQEQKEQFPRGLGHLGHVNRRNEICFKLARNCKTLCGRRKRSKKRIVLHIVISLFDPLGLLAFFIDPWLNSHARLLAVRIGLGFGFERLRTS